MEECGLCMQPMTKQDMIECRATSKFDGGVYFHNLCWNNMIRYAKYIGWIKEDQELIKYDSHQINNRRCRTIIK